jgi:hypothetical protein
VVTVFARENSQPFLSIIYHKPFQEQGEEEEEEEEENYRFSLFCQKGKWFANMQKPLQIPREEENYKRAPNHYKRAPNQQWELGFLGFSGWFSRRSMPSSKERPHHHLSATSAHHRQYRRKTVDQHSCRCSIAKVGMDRSS